MWSSFNQYALPLIDKNDNAIGQSKVFHILNLWSKYHWLPLCEGDEVQITFWGLDKNAKDYLY
jgi:hypothetical protein